MTDTQLPSHLLELVQEHLPGSIQHIGGAASGSIAKTCRIEAGGEHFFLKWAADAGGDSFEQEALGLATLRDAASLLHIPRPVAARNRDERAPGFLLMLWIEKGTPDPTFWTHLGRGLAALHQATGERYGFEEDNVIGRLPQHNTWETTWSTFFRAHRLTPQVKQARESGKWQSSWNAPLEMLYRHLETLLPAEPPASLLHGDLWNGNVLAPERGDPVLIDPAVYYGHRETDLAMSELFGGFDVLFYEAYREAQPLDPGFEERKAVYNLYHLINHLNHFGGAYAGSVEATLNRFA